MRTSFQKRQGSATDLCEVETRANEMRPAVRMETEHEMEMVEARMAEMVTETVTVKVNRPLVTVTVKVSTMVSGMAVRKARAKQAMMVRERGKIMSMAVSTTTTTMKTMVTALRRDPTTEWYLMKERSEARTATAVYSQDYYCCCWAPPRMYSEACNRKGPKTRRHRSRLCSSPW